MTPNDRTQPRFALARWRFLAPAIACTLTVAVTAACGDPIEPDRAQLSAVQSLPPAPTGLRATMKKGHALLTWSPPRGVQVGAYFLFIDQQAAMTLPATRTSYRTKELEPGSFHYLQVATVSPAGQSMPAAATLEVPPRQTSQAAGQAVARKDRPRRAAPHEEVSLPQDSADARKINGSAPREPSQANVDSHARPNGQPTKSTGTPGVAAFEEAPASHSIKVRMELIQITGYDLTDRESPHDACDGGTGGFDDIGPGTPVTVKDGAGAVLATGGFTESEFDETDRSRDPVPPGGDPEDWGDTATWPKHVVASGFCTYIGTVKVPDSAFYSVEASHRGPSVRSREDLKRSGWQIDLSLS